MVKVFMFVVNIQTQKKDKDSTAQKCIYEVIDFDDRLPLKIFYHNLPFVQHHWHEALELIFVVCGNVTVVKNGMIYKLGSEDILLVNSNEIHTTYLDNSGIILVLQISPRFIKENTGVEKITFNSLLSIPESKFDVDKVNEIKKSVLEIMLLHNKKDESVELEIKSKLYHLLYLLTSYFKDNCEKISLEEKRECQRERLQRIIKLIDENYNTISVNEIARREHISLSYLSKYFKNNVGITLKEYITKKRLEHAVKDILNTDLSLLEISLKNGFSDEKLLIKCFKEHYNMTPSQFRKMYRTFSIGDKSYFSYLNIFEDMTLSPEIFKMLEDLVSKYKQMLN